MGKNMSKDIKKVKAKDLDIHGNLKSDKPGKNKSKSKAKTSKKTEKKENKKTKKEEKTSVKSLKEIKKSAKKGNKKSSKIEPLIFTGTFISNSKGFGFVEVEDLDEDLYIPADYTLGAFHQDTVEAQLLSKGVTAGKRIEARITKILEHNMEEVVGTFQKSTNYGFVVPDNAKLNCDIFIPKEKTMGAMDGHKVVAKIYDYGRKGRNPEGEVKEIIGHISDPGVDILSIVRGFDIPNVFPDKVMKQAERIELTISEADTYGREDLRSLPMVTIDGDDTKDIDDAVSLETKGEDYILGVHIADVSNYVQESSALDKEAFSRGTSVYLVDRVIPMLPRRLSNGICSLNEGEDRLAMSCIMTINKNGEVIDYRIVESVINVNRRMTYNKVLSILQDKDDKLKEEYAEFVPTFREMDKLAKILRKRRKQRGSIDFDLPECKIEVDENGKPVSIKPYLSNDATKLIEEFMLVANETVAKHASLLNMPFLYRIHESPDMEKIEKLAAFIEGFGLYLKSDKDGIHPSEIQKLLAKVMGRDEENLITRVALRSMMMARYSPYNEGHFGLAAKYYTHFTSPIRRYPDLMIHRILKDEIRGRLTDRKREHYKQILEGIAKQCSDREKRSRDAERETDKLKKTEYMAEHIGEEFEGIISSVTNFGLYVELPDTCEGLVHISKIEGDYFYFDESRYQLVGERSRTTYRLGEKIKIKVEKADINLKTVDFVIVKA